MEPSTTLIENKVLNRCCRVAGLALLVAAAFRAININNLIVAQTTGDIGKNYSTTTTTDSVLSSLLLLLTGIWLLFLAPELKKGRRRAWYQALIIGLVLSAFGGAFWYIYPSSLALPFFLLLGLFILLPLFLYAGKCRQ